MTDEPAPIPRVRAVTGVLVETGILSLFLVVWISTALALSETLESGRQVELRDVFAFLAALLVVFVATLLVSHLVVGRGGSAPTRRWVAWECVRYGLLGLGTGLVMLVIFMEMWSRLEGIVLVLLGIALVPVALVGVGRARRWRDRVYRDQLLARLAEGYVQIEGEVLDSRSSGRMTDMTTIGWRDGDGGQHYARIVTAGQWSRLAPVSLILRVGDQSTLVHAAQQIG